MIRVFAFILSVGAVGLNLKIMPPQLPLTQGFQEFEIRFEGLAPLEYKNAKVTLEGNMSHPGMVPTFARAQETAPGVFKGRLELTMPGDWRITAHAQLKNGDRLVTHLDVSGVK